VIRENDKFFNTLLVLPAQPMQTPYSTRYEYMQYLFSRTVTVERVQYSTVPDEDMGS